MKIFKLLIIISLFINYNVKSQNKTDNSKKIGINITGLIPINNFSPSVCLENGKNTYLIGYYLNLSQGYPYISALNLGFRQNIIRNEKKLNLFYQLLLMNTYRFEDEKIFGIIGFGGIGSDYKITNNLYLGAHFNYGLGFGREYGENSNSSDLNHGLAWIYY